MVTSLALAIVYEYWFDFDQWYTAEADDTGAGKE